MSDTHKLTPGGMAIDAQGRPADMPRDLANSMSYELSNVAVLLHAALRSHADFLESGVLAGECTSADVDGMDGSSRTHSLMLMASAKLREVVEAIGPYA